MQTAIHWFQDPKELFSLSQKFVDEVLPRLNGTVQQRSIAAGKSLEVDGSLLWVIQDGDLEVQIGAKPILSLTSKSVIGPWFCASNEASFVSIKEGCRLIGYNNAELNTLFRQAPSAHHQWSALVSASAAQYFSAFAALKSRSAPPPPKFRSFSAGEVILKEGEFSQEVLCLVDGGADVIAHGAKVGKVNQEEIFGALAALTGAPRMASVVANKPSVCMVFERDDFEDLLRSHTALMSKLLEDMARAMHEANSTIAKLGDRKEKTLGGWGWI